MNLWHYSFGLLWNCRLQVEQVNSEDNDSDGDPLALALRSLRFLSASKTIRFILVYSFSDEATPLCSILCICNSVGIFLISFREALKTHFGLHNPLMTLSSLEIRNTWCLIPVLQIGACGGVTEQNLE